MPVTPQDFSLGVTQLLDDILSKEAGKDSFAEPAHGTPSEDEIRRMFQRTDELCEEVRAYFDLMAKEEEANAKQEALETQHEAEQGSQFADTFGGTFAGTATFFGSTDNLCEALEANEVRLGELCEDIVRRISAKVLSENRLQPCDPPLGDSLQLFETGTEITNVQLPELDLEKLLAECEAVRAETHQYRSLQGTLR